MKTAIPADFDPMLELARARLAAYPNHGPWEGTNHADCPICHAREQIIMAGLAAIPLPEIDEEEEHEYLDGMAQRIAQDLAGVVKSQ